MKDLSMSCSCANLKSSQKKLMTGLAVLRSFITDEYWRNFETLTLLHPYKTLQSQIAKTFARQEDVIKRYSEISRNSIEILTTEYLEEHPEVTSQNVALLRNAMELWKIASQTSDMVAPVLYHYSIHCFISFFNYTFFRWTPEHVSSHGITISKWSNELLEIEIAVKKSNKTLFQRFVDTGVLLGAWLAFSPHLPIMENEEVAFVSNGHFLFRASERISLKQLLAFDAETFDRSVNAEMPGKHLVTPFSGAPYSPSSYFKDYVIVFAASSLARYRPYFWVDILEGKTAESSDFGLALTGALVNIPRQFFHDVSLVFQEIRNGRFNFGRTPQTS
jgi:hypothetical protein